MIPGSKIKDQLQKKMQFGKISETNKQSDLAGNTDKKKDTTLSSQVSTPSTTSILSLLQNRSNEINGVQENITSLKYYHYPIDFLNKDIENIESGKKINLCLFTVNTEISKPFVLYLLNKKNNNFIWPSFKSVKNVKEECEDKLINLQILNDCEFNGYMTKNNEEYVFYKLKDNFDYDQHINADTPFWFVSMFEILFTRKVLYFDVMSEVYNLFVHDRRLQYLLDKDNLYYRLPIIFYNGAPSHKLDFYLEAGLLKASIMASQGPFYYFANYMRAAKFAAWNVMGGYKEQEIAGELITDNEFGRYIKGGVIRYIVYPGKTKVVLNRPWDPENDQVSQDKTMSKEKKKVYDTKASWSKNYESVLVGEINVDDQILHNGTSITVKDYYQYKSLSYHYLDKKTVPQQYSPEVDKDFDNMDNIKFLRIE